MPRWWVFTTYPSDGLSYNTLSHAGGTPSPNQGRATALQIDETPLGAWVQADGAMGLRDAVTPPADQVENTRALGLIIYDKYILLFQLSGLILLVAMIGAILLTMRHRKDIKRQNVLHQMWRDPAKAMELKDVKPGQGL